MIQTFESLVANKQIPIPHSRWDEILYHPVAPCADNEQMAAWGSRLMIWHGTARTPKTALFFAPKDVVCSGWVVGITND